MKSFNVLLKTELKLSIRDMNMPIFAIIMPIVITIIIGLIYGNNPAYPGANYSFIEQSFAALSSISICAGGLMGIPIGVSDYRQKKILKRFKVTPISPAKLLFAQVVMYAIYALISVVIIYLICVSFFDFTFKGSVIKFLLLYFLVMISMFSIGVMVGGLAPDTKIAGVIASILYFTMLIFSGTTLPYEVMPKVLQKISGFLPLTQGIQLIKSSVLGISNETYVFSLMLMILLAIVCTGISLKYFRWE